MMDKTDNLLRQKLNAHESPYSASALDGILSTINEDQGNRKYPVWLWLGFALLLMIFLGVLMPSILSSIKANISLAENVDQQLQAGRKGTPASTPKPGINSLSNIVTKLVDFTSENPVLKSAYSENQAHKELKTIVLFQKNKSVLQPTLVQSSIDQALPIAVEEQSSKEGEDESRGVLRFSQLPIALNHVITQTPPLGPKEPIGCPSFNDKMRKAIFLEAYISHDLPFRSLSNNSSESQVAYIASRNESESATYSYHAGIRASGYLISNFAMRVGLDYAKITEKFKVNELETTRELIIRDADGNIVSTSTEKGTRDIVKYNKIRSYNIPVSIGWHSQLGKVGLAIHGGAALNMVSSHDGIILESGTIPLMSRIVSSGSNGELAAFKNDIGLSAIGSLGVVVPIGERLDFVLEPNIKYILNPINLSTYPVEQRMFTVGLLTGLRYKF